MAAQAEAADAEDDAPPLDPEAIDRAYWHHRARRRARVEHRRATKRAGARFWLVVLILLGVTAALVDGPLVVAHSDRLDEITHGAATGRIGARSLAELRELAPGLPTLDDALAWFAAEGGAVGLHVDLKLESRLDEVAHGLERFGLAGRAVVSSSHAGVLQAVAAASSGARIGLTYPDDLLGVSRRRALWPLVRFGLVVMRATLPSRLERLLAGAGATALMLNHTLVTPGTVGAAHELGVPVLTWTVDSADEVRRVAALGVDAVISNDPQMVVATLGT
jgi:glycerophosphoryl diester phosphodiesterase